MNIEKAVRSSQVQQNQLGVTGYDGLAEYKEN